VKAALLEKRLEARFKGELGLDSHDA
jgi:hypothetical protein